MGLVINPSYQQHADDYMLGLDDAEYADDEIKQIPNDLDEVKSDILVRFRYRIRQMRMLMELWQSKLFLKFSKRNIQTCYFGTRLET